MMSCPHHGSLDPRAGGAGAFGFRGFSLIEIVLAVGIISISLVAIFGLFGTSLRSNSETIAQHEVLGLSRSLSDFLRSTNAGFSNVYSWVKDPNSDPGIYSYLQTNGQITNGLGSDAGFSGAATSRGGRLFRSILTLSPNMPLRQSDGSLIARPSAANLPASAAGFTNDAALAVQIRVYSVPSSNYPPTNLQPAFTYDTAIFR